MSIYELSIEEDGWALELLCRTKVLTCCNHHDDAYIDNGIEDSPVYKYAMTVYRNSNGKSPFESAKEMTDAIKSIYEQYGGNDVCPQCEKRASS